MKSFLNHITEQVDLKSKDGVLSAITVNKANGEILNPDFIRISDAAKRLFEKDRNVVQAVALEAIRELRAKGIEVEPVIDDFYYNIPSYMNGLGKLQKMVDKAKKNPSPYVQKIVNASTKLISDWLHVYNDMTTLKGMVVKVSQKRAEAKVQATAALTAKAGNSAALVNLLQTHIDEYKKMAENKAKEFIQNRLDFLKKHNWDLDKALPRVSANSASYKEYQAKRAVYTSITKATSSSRSMRDPDIREPNQVMINHYIQTNVKGAEDAYLSFIHKMVEKVGKPVASATMNGNIWTNALLTVTCDVDEVQTWKTQMIINISKFSTLFNQFPTRRIK